MNKYIKGVDHQINQFDLLGTFGTMKEMAAEYMFFSSTHGVLTKIHQMLYEKNKFQQISQY